MSLLRLTDQTSKQLVSGGADGYRLTNPRIKRATVEGPDRDVDTRRELLGSPSQHSANRIGCGVCRG